MRLIVLFLFLLLVGIQYPLWLGKGGWLRVAELEQQVAEQEKKNTDLRARNARLAGEVHDLTKGTHAIEERARSELGMIKHDEVFVQFVAPSPVAGGASDAQASDAGRVPGGVAKAAATDRPDKPEQRKMVRQAAHAERSGLQKPTERVERSVVHHSEKPADRIAEKPAAKSATSAASATNGGAPKPAPKKEPKKESRSATVPESRVEVKAESRAESRPDSKVGSKFEPKANSKPSTRQLDKPATEKKAAEAPSERRTDKQGAPVKARTATEASSQKGDKAQNKADGEKHR